MEFSNAKTIKSFVATGSKYTINNSENVKESVFLTERFFVVCLFVFDKGINSLLSGISLCSSEKS